MQTIGRFLCVVAIALTSLVSVARGQTSSASISGLVMDQTGASVPDVAITVTDINRNVIFNSVSNEQGLYLVVSLPPGTYSLAAEKSGFRRHVLDSIQLSTQQKAVADITLELGAVTESVSVTANALELETGTSTLSAVIENKKIVDLPLNGRNVFSLALLAAGVYASIPTSATGGIGDVSPTAAASRPTRFCSTACRSTRTASRRGGNLRLASLQPTASKNFAYRRTGLRPNMAAPAAAF